MDFRRIPFQFSSTDPAKRQAELQKRFGLPVNNDKDNMHIDFSNTGLMGIGQDGRNSASNSPRLQHRVPVFKEGSPESTMSSVDSHGSPVAGRKPHVRVVPIEIEGNDNSTKRHRNLSGSSNTVGNQPRQNGTSWLPEEFAPCTKSPVPDAKSNPSRERTIPIHVENASQIKKAKTVPVQKERSFNQDGPKQNGCSPSKVDKPAYEPNKILVGLSLKKIERVLEKLKVYHADVEKFTGTVKERQYRYLDEMLTRLMLELDDVDTMGNEEVRLSRKAAVKKVQASVDLLEAKITRKASEQVSDEPIKENNLDQDVEMEVSRSQDEAMGDVDNAVERMCQVTVEPTSEGNQTEKEQDEEMENGHLETAGKASAENVKGGEFPVMEVEETESVSIESKPVVTTLDRSTEELESNNMSSVATEMNIEEAKGESVKEKEQISLTNEPVVSLADNPVELKRNIELDSAGSAPSPVNGKVLPIVEGKVTEENMETSILSDTTACIEELVTKSSHVGEDVSVSQQTVIPNEHSKDLSSENLVLNSDSHH